ncbi:type III-A CRISPR-associated RAMP protein Csm3 [Sulfurihydrogenibium sp.]|jgi:CRISPR-associated protein Csm3|uniref:type III-A CRISPR-associated RAMP protein Csm3 n=1 Tax=Sulfurihydrogenibium sp. TaxID=2053621 RepID=UPI00262CA42E|nr:type III-A CRISPR-associated RAMP protein Csm3 [Sulfurihydrogenibium sp.]
MSKALKGIIKLECKIRVLTGLHIGGSKENVEIGGIDNIVIKVPVLKLDEAIERDVPYIPGSSIKGKMRALLEWVEKPEGSMQVIALENKGEPCNCGRCRVCKLFGAHKNAKTEEPVRLRVEDFYPTEKTIDMWKKFLDGDFVEVKVENTIDRIKGTALHPRHQERVIPFSEFTGFIKIRVHEGDRKELFDTIIRGIQLLEDDYLGGSGSRGYGKVKFIKEKILWTDYRKQPFEEKIVDENEIANIYGA